MKYHGCKSAAEIKVSQFTAIFFVDYFCAKNKILWNRVRRIFFCQKQHQSTQGESSSSSGMKCVPVSSCLLLVGCLFRALVSKPSGAESGEFCQGSIATTTTTTTTSATTKFHCVWFCWFLLYTLKFPQRSRKEKKIVYSIKIGGVDLIDGLTSGARNMAAIAIATATAGIIVGAVSLTGFGLVLNQWRNFKLSPKNNGKYAKKKYRKLSNQTSELKPHLTVVKTYN